MQKLVLSRKGFDSRFGGFPSPIFEDNSLISLPIPEKNGSCCYGELNPQGVNLGIVVSDLTRGRITDSHTAHLDPDLDPTALSRSEYWRPAFGQAGIAASHLRKQGVNSGDIFLFFGWFRRVETIAGKVRYILNSPDLHIIFGWLHISEILDPSESQAPKGLERHPHFAKLECKNNQVYLAGSPADAGIFPRYCEHLQLTAPGSSRSHWRLPVWFYPAGRQPLTYHCNLNRWRPDGDIVYLNSAYPGQEFVLDVDAYPEARSWLEKIINHAA